MLCPPSLSPLSQKSMIILVLLESIGDTTIKIILNRKNFTHILFDESLILPSLSSIHPNLCTDPPAKNGYNGNTNKKNEWMLRSCLSMAPHLSSHHWKRECSQRNWIQFYIRYDGNAEAEKKIWILNEANQYSISIYEINKSQITRSCFYLVAFFHVLF